MLDLRSLLTSAKNEVRTTFTNVRALTVTESGTFPTDTAASEDPVQINYQTHGLEDIIMCAFFYYDLRSV